jgi:hypothetical protein
MLHFVALPARRRLPGIQYQFRYDTGVLTQDVGELAHVIVQVLVDHRDGGMNWFSGSSEERGVELTITDLTVAPDGVITQALGRDRAGRLTGLRVLLLPLARRNDRATTRAAEWMDSRVSDLVALWLSDQPAAIAQLRSLRAPDRVRREMRHVAGTCLTEILP